MRRLIDLLLPPISEPSPASNAAVDRLGEVLRSNLDPDIDCLRDLAAYRDRHVGTLGWVLLKIRELDLSTPATVTARLKNAGTIIEKLHRRQKMRLTQMQDIAGIRVVLNSGGRDRQDEVARLIGSAFPGESTRTIDRRKEPESGYRAVHVVVKAMGHWAEIQVRTGLQDQWAQIYERLGDMWGRQIRFGEPPDQADEKIDVRGATLSRLELIRELLHHSEQIADVETAELQGLPDDGRREDLEYLLEAFAEVLPSSSPTSLTWASGPRNGDAPVHFVVAYERRTGKIHNFFSGTQEVVLTTRLRLESDWWDNPDVEIVQFVSESEESLKRSHARYFEEMLSLLKGKRKS